MTGVIPVTHPLHVGTVVRDRRRALRLRQKDVAAAAGIHYLWIRDLELGRKNPGFANMIRVLSALDIACALVLRDDPQLCAAPYLKRRLPAASKRRRKSQAPSFAECWWFGILEHTPEARELFRGRSPTIRWVFREFA